LPEVWEKKEKGSIYGGSSKLLPMLMIQANVNPRHEGVLKAEHLLTQYSWRAVYGVLRSRTSRITRKPSFS
jgi:hypothetical protein